jgi:hypothetical protein
MFCPTFSCVLEGLPAKMLRIPVPLPTSITILSLKS